MDIVIFFSRKRKLFLVTGQIIFVLLGALLFLKPEIVIVIRDEIFIRMAGAISLSYFGIMFLFSLKVYFRKVALMIAERGVFDNSNYLSTGFIPWSNIIDINQIQDGSVFMIKISLTDSNLVIDKERNFIKKYLLKKQDKRFGSPVIIPMIGLNSYVDTLERQLKERWEYFKKSH